jgi:hypothetical protein
VELDPAGDQATLTHGFSGRVANATDLTIYVYTAEPRTRSSEAHAPSDSTERQAAALLLEAEAQFTRFR